MKQAERAFLPSVGGTFVEFRLYYVSHGTASDREEHSDPVDTRLLSGLQLALEHVPLRPGLEVREPRKACPQGCYLDAGITTSLAVVSASSQHLVFLYWSMSPKKPRLSRT